MLQIQAAPSPRIVNWRTWPRASLIPNGPWYHCLAMIFLAGVDVGSVLRWLLVVGGEASERLADDGGVVGVQAIQQILAALTA